MRAVASSARRPTRGRVVACAVVILSFAIPALALILGGLQRTAAYADQVEYHLPTLEQFARQWPAFDFANATAAMTPGYHLLMAVLVRAGGSTLLLQLATATITAGLLATLAWVVSGRLSPIDTILLCLPMAWSQYVFTAGVYVVPHNLGWWGVLLMLTVATRPHWSVRSAIAGGLLLAATVFVRQIHLWAAAGLVTAAVAGGAGCHRLGERTRRALIAVACCLPAIGVLACFYWLWGGLAPKTQQWARAADGVNFAAITMILATFGLLAPLLIARLPAGRRQWGMTIAGGVIGIGVALIGATTLNPDAGRWSGLWNLAGALGTRGERSVLITLLSGVGAACTGLLLASAERRQGWIWAALLAGFVASNAAVNQAWQRYYEPMLLMACILLLNRTATPTVWQRWARAALAVVQAGLLAWSLRG